MVRLQTLQVWIWRWILDHTELHGNLCRSVTYGGPYDVRYTACR